MEEVILSLRPRQIKTLLALKEDLLGGGIPGLHDSDSIENQLRILQYNKNWFGSEVFVIVIPFYLFGLVLQGRQLINDWPLFDE